MNLESKMWKFNKGKLIEALLFFARYTDPSKYGVLKALKLLYFSDLLHLKEYQRTITGDEYSRIDHGPIPKKSYTLIRELYKPQYENIRPDPELQAAINIQKNQTQRGTTQFRIRAKRKFREEKFSDSELEIMKKVAEIYRDETADMMEKSSYQWTEKELGIDLSQLSIGDTIPHEKILSQEERNFVKEIEKESKFFEDSIGIRVSL